MLTDPCNSVVHVNSKSCSSSVRPPMPSRFLWVEKRGQILLVCYNGPVSGRHCWIATSSRQKDRQRERIEKKEERDRELELKYENFILQGL